MRYFDSGTCTIEQTWPALGESIATISTPLFTLAPVDYSLLKGSIATNYSASRNESIPYEITSWEEIHVARIRALRGKYRDKLPSTEDFVLQKQKEIELER